MIIFVCLVALLMVLPAHSVIITVLNNMLFTRVSITDKAVCETVVIVLHEPGNTNLADMLSIKRSSI